MKDIRFSLCAFFIAAATWTYQAQARCTFPPDLQTVSAFVALLVLMRPSSPVLFVLLMFFQTASIYVTELPQHVNSNRILQFFIGLMFFAAATPSIVRSLRRKRLRRDKLFQSFRPLACQLLVIVYALAFWHKLNFGFLDPEISYAVRFYPDLRANLAFLVDLPKRDTIGPFVIYGTLIVEATIPLLLIFRRTRNAGIMAGLTFHFGLSITGFYAFTSTMIALFCFYLPENITERIKTRINLAWFAVFRQALVLTMLAITIAVVYRHWSWELTPRFEQRASAMKAAAPEFLTNQRWFETAVNFVSAANQTWTTESETLFGYFAWLYLLPIVAYFALSFGTPHEFIRARKLFQIHPLLAVFPLLVIFNGVCPYLGLKNTTSFEMFSNLHIEEGRTNHLIIGRCLPLANYQSDVVRIVDSSDAELKDHADRGARIAMIDLRRKIIELREKGHENIAIVYERHGVEHAVAAAEKDPVLCQPLNYFERKFVVVKPVYPARPRERFSAN